MALTVTFFTFSKKENSTARPTGGTAYSCVLKSSSGVINPTIELLFAGNVESKPFTWNYCYITEYSRYYFVSEWKYNDRKWYADLNEDILGTWKTEIGSSTLYVTRSASSYSYSAKDTFYPALTTPVYVKTEQAIGYVSGTGSLDYGTYIIGVVNRDDSVQGGIAYYALSGSEMAVFRKYMLASIGDWGSFSGFIGEASKALVDPFQYVVSCLWYPFNLRTGATTELMFGFWSTGITVHKLETYTHSINLQFTRPEIPSGFGTVRGEWQYREPFATYYLQYTPFGLIPIDSEAINSLGITTICNIDLMSGTAVLTIYRRQTNTTIFEISKHTAQIGVPIQLSQVTTDYGGMIQGVANAASSVEYLNAGGLVLGAANAVGSALAPKVQVSGSVGSIAELSSGNIARLIGAYLKPADEDIEHYGRPVMKLLQISSLSGYVQVADGDIAISGTKEECQALRKYLEGGFYYE